MESYNDLLPTIKAAQATESLVIEVNEEIVDIPMVGIPDLSECGGHDGPTDPGDSRWSVISEALTYEGRISMPADNALRSKVISLFHDNLESGHFGALRTAELVSGDFYWPSMDATIRKYIVCCEVCHRIKAPRHARHGINTMLPPPFLTWEGVTMDLVMDLPKSTALGSIGILVVVERLNKMAICLPCRKDIDSPELAQMFVEHVICKHGVPDDIITGRGMQFTSRF